MPPVAGSWSSATIDVRRTSAVWIVWRGNREHESRAQRQETVRQMTDDERFSLIISVLRYVPGSSLATRDSCIPADLANLIAGYR